MTGNDEGMSRLHRVRHQKGITPVIAIVLLLMMTVALGGAVFAWFSQMQEDFQDRAEDQINTRVSVEDLICSSADDEIRVYIKNTGDESLSLTNVDMYVRMPDSSLNSTLTETGMDWSGSDFADSGGFGSQTIPSDLENGQFYSVTFEFTQAGLETSAGGCIAE